MKLYYRYLGSYKGMTTRSTFTLKETQLFNNHIWQDVRIFEPGGIIDTMLS